MWRLLYALREGHNFRRQVPLGPHFLDFACHGLKLAIEIDGDSHGTDAAKAYDLARTSFIQSEGYRVLRFTNDDVLKNPEGVFKTVTRAIEETAQ